MGLSDVQVETNSIIKIWKEATKEQRRFIEADLQSSLSKIKTSIEMIKGLKKVEWNKKHNKRVKGSLL